MSKKVYEVETVLALTLTFEVDANNESDARRVAEEAIKTGTLPFIKRDYYDEYDIDVTDVQESEGY